MTRQKYALIVGQGRSGTNWLLDIFDASAQTFCRNEPNAVSGSPCGQLAPLWRVEPQMQDMDQLWDDIAAQMGRRMGERDHRLKHPKQYVHPLSRQLGIASFPARPKIRAALQTIAPGLRGGEWDLPWWVGDQSKLAAALAVFKINRASRIATWLLRNRPQVPVIHIIRHPGGRLNSWVNRFLSDRDKADIDHRNKTRLREVLVLAPEWQPLFKDIENMSIAESETWFWRYVTETIHRAGEGLSQYKCVVYEDLAADPLGVAREIYDFCGLPFTPEVEKIIVGGLGKSVWGKLDGTPKSVAQAWRHKLTPDELMVLDQVLKGSLMEQWWNADPNQLLERIPLGEVG
jgi:hypothetical protein